MRGVGGIIKVNEICRSENQLESSINEFKTTETMKLGGRCVPWEKQERKITEWGTTWEEEGGKQVWEKEDG